MTWTYSIPADNSEIVVYDHTGTEAATVPNDGSGITVPDDVLDVMAQEFDAALSNDNRDRALKIARDAAFEQIEEQPK